MPDFALRAGRGVRALHSGRGQWCAPRNCGRRHLAEALWLVESVRALQGCEVYVLLHSVSFSHEAPQQRVTYACAPVARQPRASSPQRRLANRAKRVSPQRTAA